METEGFLAINSIIVVVVLFIIFWVMWRNNVIHCSKGGIHTSETDADVMRRIVPNGLSGYRLIFVGASIPTGEFVHCTKCHKRLRPYYSSFGYYNQAG